MKFIPLILIFICSNALAASASWYSIEACQFNPDERCPTASGISLYELEKFAAIWDVPFGTRLKVCNQDGGRCTVVIVRDRGPAKRLNRAIDLSKNTFFELSGGNLKEGLIEVTIERL